MNWREFKEQVDTELENQGVDEEHVDISYIDYNAVDDVHVEVTQVGDGRTNLSIS